MFLTSVKVGSVNGDFSSYNFEFHMSMILKLFTFKHFDRFEKTLTRLDGLVPPNHKSRKKYSYSDSIAPKLLQTSVCCRIQQLDKV